MSGRAFIRIGLLAACLLVPTSLASYWAIAAGERLERAQSEEDDDAEVAVASKADEDYCTPGLQKVLRRVLESCGLLGSDSARGCEPADAKTVATMSGDDFNALFRPMKDRGGIVQFETDSAELDDRSQKLVDELFAAQRGASYFFIVARASQTGSADYNKKLSKKRAQAIMDRLQNQFEAPKLREKVGLLWLGEEYAQLDEEFCSWRRSGTGDCSQRALNRSAFIAWIDCTL